MNALLSALVGGAVCIVVGAALSWLMRVPATTWIPAGLTVSTLIAVYIFLSKQQATISPPG